MNKFRGFLMMLTVMLGLLFAGSASASVTDGRIVANIDLIETSGTTLRVAGWVYDNQHTNSSLNVVVDFVSVYTANKAKSSVHSSCPVGGNHYFDFTYSWSNSGVRVMINVPYADGTGNASIYDNGAYFMNIYNVAYHANGGSGAPSSDSKHENIRLRLSTKAPTRTGYTFKGWSASPSGSVVSVYNGNAHTTFYAIWTPNTYTVTYNANGGQSAPAAQSGKYDTSITLSSTVPQYEGRDFQGWAESAGGAVVYKPGSKIVIKKNLTLYAVWKMKTYPVSYDANGGTDAPAAQTKTYGQDLTLSTAVPEREDYVFLGWATNAGADAAEIQPGDLYKANAALTLYAVWTEARLPGDINGDKQIDIQDAMLLLNYLVDNPVSIVERNADVTGDNMIDGRDVLRLMKYLVEQDIVLE